MIDKLGKFVIKGSFVRLFYAETEESKFIRLLTLFKLVFDITGALVRNLANI